MPAAAASDARVIATLVGDLAPYKALPVLTSQVLLFPSPAGSTLEKVLADHPEKWLLVDKSMVTLDGSECDKIGTSFSAFRFQSSGCSRVVGSCLNNQIGQLVAADESRVKQGKDPLYFVARYFQGGKNTIKPGSGRFSLQLPVAQILSSIVVLDVAADSIRFTVNAVPGKVRCCSRHSLYKPPAHTHAYVWLFWYVLR